MENETNELQSTLLHSSAKHAIIYHKDCNDGFASAWLMAKLLEEKGEDYTLYAMHYGDNVPNIENSYIWILDFSLPYSILLTLSSKNNNIMLMDHHASAFKLLSDSYADVDEIPKDAYYINDNKENNISILLQNNRSGCGMAMDFCMHEKANIAQNKRVVAVIEAIEDRDLWRFKLPDTEIYSALISSIDKTVECWDRVLLKMNDDEFAKIFERAKIINEYENTTAAAAAKKVKIIDFQEMKVPVTNCTSLISLTNDKMNKYTGISMTYFIMSDSNLAIISLRSRGDINVATIAEKFGGGGHKNAAGFKLSLISLIDLLDGKL